MSSYLLIKSPKGSNPSDRRFTNVLMSVRHESNKTTAIAKIDYVRQRQKMLKFLQRLLLHLTDMTTSCTLPNLS